VLRMRFGIGMNTDHPVTTYPRANDFEANES
jgi:hypothetical protein